MNNGNKFTAEELESIWKEMLAKDDRKPKHLDRSAWEPCEECKTCTNCLSSLDGCLTDIYSPCFDCDDFSNFNPRNFCNGCGRPLTDAAWNMLEKRLEKL